MKTLKIIGLGIAIWALSLVWPEINQTLSPQIMTRASIGLSVVILIYQLTLHLKKRRQQPTNQGSRSNHPSRPMPPIALAGR